MLALSSTTGSLTLKKSSGVAPRVHLALELADLSPPLSAHSTWSSTMSQDRSNDTSLLGSPTGIGLSGLSPWSPPYDPFAGGRMSPDQSEWFRQHQSRELQRSGRGPVPSAVGEPPRSRSYGANPTSVSRNIVPLLQHDLLPNPTPEDANTTNRRQSQDIYNNRTESPTSGTYSEYEIEAHNARLANIGRSTPRYQTRRRPFNQDEFDGPSQLLPLPLPQQEHSRSQTLPALPTYLELSEQDEIIKRVNDVLSDCAYHFVAKYQFPIPLERDKPRVCGAEDREWTEWAYLLKRLATKRRIPARVLYDNQIKQFVTTLENSISIKQSTREQHSRILKDDRYMLQLISSGTQVAKILVDSLAMQQLDDLYKRTESLISHRRETVGRLNFQ